MGVMDKWNFVVCRTNEGAMVDRTLYSNWEKSIPTIINKPFRFLLVDLQSAPGGRFPGLSQVVLKPPPEAAEAILGCPPSR